ncbi:hypothetical protein ABK040_004680 [Willaertia magna]
MPKHKRVGKYELLEKLGEGNFSKVKRAIDTDSGQQYAIKIVDISSVAKEGMEKQVRNEISVLKAIKHPNVVQLKEVLKSTNNIYIVMELITGGELFDKIVAQRRFSEDVARRYFQQLIDGIAYCHSNRIAHRDLKPENLLLDSNDNLKITDFGLSGMMKQGVMLETICGTPHYVAPEVLTGNYDGFKADIWSCGIILFVMLSGCHPFDGETVNDLFKRIENLEFKYPSHFSKESRALLDKIIVVDPNKRATIDDIRNDPWFRIGYQPHVDQNCMIDQKLNNETHNNLGLTINTSNIRINNNNTNQQQQQQSLGVGGVGTDSFSKEEQHHHTNNSELNLSIPSSSSTDNNQDFSLSIPNNNNNYLIPPQIIVKQEDADNAITEIEEEYEQRRRTSDASPNVMKGSKSPNTLKQQAITEPYRQKRRVPTTSSINQGVNGETRMSIRMQNMEQLNAFELVAVMMRGKLNPLVSKHFTKKALRFSTFGHPDEVYDRMIYFLHEKKYIVKPKDTEYEFKAILKHKLNEIQFIVQFFIVSFEMIIVEVVRLKGNTLKFQEIFRELDDKFNYEAQKKFLMTNTPHLSPKVNHQQEMMMNGNNSPFKH